MMSDVTNFRMNVLFYYTFTVTGHLSDTEICPTPCTKFCGHLSDNLTWGLVALVVDGDFSVPASGL